ncbi:DUF4328 domain-containing protein [Streptomyces dysideae]|uniref:DUF4328 domain-containing protein n=1 Tax=Streptomyces dysideae TaxID=909626 RepID=A0A117S1P6_9ACTN|nr:DUF4328 domain-containing protein [Streptomyces dysideae]KUO21757.1 hypothetical protein AQJ91_07910 [Streptomyces dysideae]
MIDNHHDHFIAPAAWLRSPIGLGWAAVSGLALVIATDLFAVWADVVMYDVAGDLASGAVFDERAERADLLYSAAGVVQTVALLTSAVLFLCWFHRVRVNAEVFNPHGHSKKRGWAIGGWFTPIVNLWFPRRITLDIWDASSPWDAPRPQGLVNTWWTFWVISLVSGRAALTAYRKAETAEEIRDAVQQVIFSDVIDIVAAAFAIVVVLRLTRMQHEKALAGSAPAPA